ncbi:MAG: DrmB family protein [Flavobacterium sp.]|uniref:DrmB family protein n=1 Tax=Flavobacterium sp. TaxID=239 RepID=UPI003BE30DB4
MATKQYFDNTQANEAISKFKLLSAYGGPGSIVHTAFGSIIVSCIEEWGFLKKILEIQKEAVDTGKKEKEIKGYVIEQARLERNGSVGLSNDTRLLKSLINRKGLTELKYLVLIPDITVQDFSNKIKNNGNELAINSSFMPKVFFDKSKHYKFYKEWFKDWVSNKKNDDQYGNRFFPPKYNTDKGTYNLAQDNIVLICDHGHISDFPWSKFLRWRTDSPMEINSEQPIELFNSQPCCGTEDTSISKIKITSSTANASGFDGKWLKCENCGRQTSLKGLMSVKIKCPGHKPWEAITSNNGELKYHSGNPGSRNQMPPFETCLSSKAMKVALTTGNNLYYSRMLSSIYMPDELFLDEKTLKLNVLEKELELAMDDKNFEEAMKINSMMTSLKAEIQNNPPLEIIHDSEKDVLYRFEEYRALALKGEEEINIDKVNEHLKVKDVTINIKGSNVEKYFSRILRIDNMKITSAQLDFSRVVPVDSDADNISSKNIFSSKQKNSVEAYPVVENYGEGIFFSFKEELMNEFANSGAIVLLNKKLKNLSKNSGAFSEGAIKYGLENNWQLYIVHTFAHLIMRELEFKCGYPTASLSERIYVSNNAKYKMYGCMIYTAEGAEGSMGGLIAQTRPKNLLSLIQSALRRATICNSDPLCWESEGQGLFELNFASCFSCSLVSETSCEHRNIYLDRRILVDENNGFFKDVI